MLVGAGLLSAPVALLALLLLEWPLTSGDPEEAVEMVEGDAELALIWSMSFSRHEDLLFSSSLSIWLLGTRWSLMMTTR